MKLFSLTCNLKFYDHQTGCLFCLPAFCLSLWVWVIHQFLKRYPAGSGRTELPYTYFTSTNNIWLTPLETTNDTFLINESDLFSNVWMKKKLVGWCLQSNKSLEAFFIPGPQIHLVPCQIEKKKVVLCCQSSLCWVCFWFEQRLAMLS